MKMRNVLHIITLSIAIVISINFAYGNPKTPNLFITDQAGRQVNIPAKIGKVISLWPEATRGLYALGIADRIVGLDEASLTCPILTRAFPKMKNVKNVGSATKGTVSEEKLAQLKPDIIFARTDDPDFADRIQRTLRVPVVCVRMHPPDIRNISFDMINIIGQCVGKGEKAKEVQKFLEEQLDDITSITSKIDSTKRPRVYQAFAYDLLKTIGYFDVIDLAGGESVAKNAFKQAWYTVSMEDILRWNPDVIILHGFGRFTPETLIHDAQWTHVKAVQTGDVYKTTIGWTGWDPGGFVINVMHNSKIFYPEKFSFNITEKANDIFKRMYAVNNLYSIIARDYGLSNIDKD